VREVEKSIPKNNHHLLFYDKEWSLRPEGLYLREHAGLRIDLPIARHAEMHRRVALVPLLGVHALQRVASDYKPSNSLHKNIDNFLVLTERALKHINCHLLEKKLGGLTIEAMIMQVDILKEFQTREL